MSTPKEIKKEINTSEDLTDVTKKGGEIGDKEAEAATGGAIYQPHIAEDWKPIEPRQKR